MASLRKIAPFGTWTSPITSSITAAGVVLFAGLMVDVSIVPYCLVNLLTHSSRKQKTYISLRIGQQTTAAARSSVSMQKEVRMPYPRNSMSGQKSTPMEAAPQLYVQMDVLYSQM